MQEDHQKLQQAAQETASQVQQELQAHDPSKKGAGLGVALLAPVVIDFLKGLGENQLQALTQYIGSKFSLNLLKGSQQQQQGQ